MSVYCFVIARSCLSRFTLKSPVIISNPSHEIVRSPGNSSDSLIDKSFQLKADCFCFDRELQSKDAPFGGV